MRLPLISAFLCYISVYSSPIPLFVPPPSWQYAEPKNGSSYIQASFFGRGSTQFRPSINLSMEEIDISLKEYVKAVKEIHLKEPNTTWRDLGKFTMQGGVGRLTEIVTKHPFGEVKVLQAILVEGKMAYILTASALKNEDPGIQKELLKSLQSLVLEENLFSALKSESKREKLKEIYSALGSFPQNSEPLKAKQIQWELLQKQIEDQYPEMGGHWQVLALKEGLGKIMGGT